MKRTLTSILAGLWILLIFYLGGVELTRRCMDYGSNIPIIGFAFFLSIFISIWVYFGPWWYIKK
jgi:uncharacterized membrane protein required for colicin V production